MENFQEDCCNELLYADDTLLLGAHAQTIERQLQCIVAIGAEYGMEMNWQKVEVLNAKGAAQINRPDGGAIAHKTSLTYLGSLVSADGGIKSELARRLGMAHSEFNKIQHVWRHTKVSKAEKYRVYVSCVVSRLLYGLQTAVLDSTAQRKLDGFHANCCRKIAGIAPSYYSRIPNTTVWELLGATRLTTMLLEQQLGFFGKLARRPTGCPVRRLVFESDLSRKVPSFDRRRGRPNLEWCSIMHNFAGEMFESVRDFRACVVDAAAWRTHVRQYCRARRST